MSRTIRDMPPAKFWRNEEVSGFVGKIAANPDDDLARLVFADWLEDTAGGDIDQQHAAFIREHIACHRTLGQTVHVPVPGPIKERVFAGFSLGGLVGYDVVPLLGADIVARVERGFLSKMDVFHGPESASRYSNSLHNLFEAVIGGQVGGRSPLIVNMLEGQITKPIAMFHPYWVELDKPELLGLGTFRGNREERGQIMAAYYLGEKYVYDLRELRSMGEPAAGRHVITHTLVTFWESRFARIRFPARVRLSAALVKHVNDRMRVVNPL